MLRVLRIWFQLQTGRFSATANNPQDHAGLFHRSGQMGAPFEVTRKENYVQDHFAWNWFMGVSLNL